MMDDPKIDAEKKTGERKTPKVIWDDSDLRMSYANVVNITSTREEVTLFFGTNQTWNTLGDEFKVKLTDRIVVNPFAAKRMLALLTNILTEYERRYGTLDVEVKGPESTP